MSWTFSTRGQCPKRADEVSQIMPVMMSFDPLCLCLVCDNPCTWLAPYLFWLKVTFLSKRFIVDQYDIP